MKARYYAALALLSGIVLAPPAGAATISGTYFEDIGGASCTLIPGDSCGVAFATLPSSLTGQFLTITEVNCALRSTKAVNHAQLTITDDLTNPRRSHNVSVPGLVGLFTFRDAVNFKIAGGPPRRLVITFTGENGQPLTTASCMVIGTISAQ